MRLFFLALSAAALAAGVIGAMGASLPVPHRASRKASYHVPPETLFAAIAGPPDWRSGVKRFGALPAANGGRRWYEEDSHGSKITYEVLEETPPKRLVVRIADRGLPFGGTWSYDVAPTPGGGAELRITENGEIYNVFYRFLSRFVLGYTRTMDTYLRDLGAKFSQPVEIES